MYKKYLARALIQSLFVCIIALVSLYIILTPSQIMAQIAVPGGETILTLNPETPRAEEPFTARVEAYAYDINRSTISWSINGEPLTEYSGEQKISLTAPPLGIPMDVTVQVVEQGGISHTVTKTIIPSAIDIIIESDTRIPSFYKGRALPTAGSGIRIVAFPSIYTRSGLVSRSQNLIYTWKIDSKIVKAGVGMNVLTTTMPPSSIPLIELTAETADGIARHTSYVKVIPKSAQNIFYEENPLYGISRNALPSDFILLNEEITVRAEPYFMSQTIFNNAQYNWNINGVSTDNPSSDPQTLTLRRVGGGSSANIDFSVRNLKSLLQSAKGGFTIHFN